MVSDNGRELDQGTGLDWTGSCTGGVEGMADSHRRDSWEERAEGSSGTGRLVVVVKFVSMEGRNIIVRR